MFSKVDETLKNNYIQFREAINTNAPKEVFEKLLNQDINIIIFNPIFLMDFLTMADWPMDYIKNNLDRILSRNDGCVSCIYPITKCAIRAKRYDVLILIAYHPSLKVRAEFMRNLTLEYRNYIDIFYPNGIINYFANKDSSGIVEIMDEKDVSQIACNLFDCDFKDKIYNEIKDFIFNNYPQNHLAQYIDKHIKEDEQDIFHYKETLLKDINQYFKTSVNYKYELIEKYGSYIDDNLIKEYLQIYNLVFDSLRCVYNNDVVNCIKWCNLRDKFFTIIEKYLKKEKTEIITFKGVGTTSVALEIGSFLLKYSVDKYAKQFKTPNNFLVVKNYEYYEYCDFLGLTAETIEVQLSLSKPYIESKDKDRKLEELFRNELASQGYVLEDYFVRDGSANCFFLDDYHDADCDNPEELPDWFKESPLVLVDRDLVIPIDKKEEYENGRNLILN